MRMIDYFIGCQLSTAVIAVDIIWLKVFLLIYELLQGHEAISLITVIDIDVVVVIKIIIMIVTTIIIDVVIVVVVVIVVIVVALVSECMCS